VDWSTACPDWRERIVAGRSLMPVAPLFPDEAAEAMAVFDDLLVVDAVGSPRMGDVARPWIRDFVSAIFGAYAEKEGRRLINQFFLLISKKNGKSTTAAGIMVTALVRNWRESGEFGILAPPIEAADNAFKPARDMVKKHPHLSDLMHVQDHIRMITHRGTGATLKVVAADSDAVSGKKWIGTLVDELWGFGKQAKAADMLLEATGGMASRPEGFVVYLSTHSNEPPAGVFRQKLLYARGVRDGRIQDRKFLPVLYEFPEAMVEAGEHKQPANFYVTNPNLGASVDEEFLTSKMAEAQENGEDALRGFLAKHLNVEIGLALGTDRWAGAEHWQKNARALTLDQLIERSDVITVGIDGGGLDDLLGLVALGRDGETGEKLCWAHAWCNAIVLERRKGEASKLRDFAKAGDLTIVDAPGRDVSELGDYIHQIEASGLLDRIGVDQAGIGAVVDEIVDRGIEFERIIGIPQGWRLVGAIKTCERWLAEGKLLHGGQGVMAYSVANAKVEPRGNAVMITKQIAGAAKIDPLMALFDAVALMAMNPQARTKTYQAFFV
jgi:phage terminase large subunit-like protein